MRVLIGGIIALLLGFGGLIGWWSEFVDILQGVIPFLLLVGGGVAANAGIASVKDKAEKKREEEIKEIEKRVADKIRLDQEEFKKEKERKEAGGK